MTCIIGLEYNNKVYLGCDSQSTEGWTSQIISYDKIFKRGEFLFGVSGYPRVNQILNYSLPLIPQLEKQDDMNYLVSVFVKSVRECFKEHEIGSTDDDGSHYGNSIVLFGYRKKLYLLDSNFQIVRFAEGYTAIGTGKELALGAMFVTSNLAPKQRILKSLEASAYFNIGVGKPFKVMNI